VIRKIDSERTWLPHLESGNLSGHKLRTTLNIYIILADPENFSSQSNEEGSKSLELTFETSGIRRRLQFIYRTEESCL
jgi:hypothetical protein